jgi:hypothetical protein
MRHSIPIRAWIDWQSRSMANDVNSMNRSHCYVSSSFVCTPVYTKLAIVRNTDLATESSKKRNTRSEAS